jgi:hypothetical protein
MLESTQVARSGLERALAEVEALGLARPANVLLTEYLGALWAEGLVDAAAADRIAAAYNRVRYSPLVDDDPQVRESVEELGRVAERLAAMSPQDRLQLARRVSGRIQSSPNEQLLERETERLGDAPKTAVAPRSARAPRQNQHPSASPLNGATLAEPADASDPFVPSSPATDRRRPLLPRLSLELVAVLVLVAFFGGYFGRDSVNRVRQIGNDSAESGGPNEVSARDAWKNPELWLNGIRFRADEAARSHQYTKARLALELALAYSPHCAGMFNDLAALYLNPDETGNTDPKRALQLAERALDYSRQPAILDTAAQAHFQLGNVREAIGLEAESLAKGSESGEGENDEFRQYRQRQLKKFEDANQIRTAESPPAASRLGTRSEARQKRS